MCVPLEAVINARSSILVAVAAATSAPKPLCWPPGKSTNDLRSLFEPRSRPVANHGDRNCSEFKVQRGQHMTRRTKFMSVSGGRACQARIRLRIGPLSSLALPFCIFGQCALALSTFLVRVIEGIAACLGRAPFYMRRQRERRQHSGNTG